MRYVIFITTQAQTPDPNLRGLWWLWAPTAPVAAETFFWKIAPFSNEVACTTMFLKVHAIYVRIMTTF